MRNKLIRREIRRCSKLEGAFALVIRCSEVSLDPDIIIVDKVAVKFCHRTLWNSAEEYNKSPFFTMWID